MNRWKYEKYPWRNKQFDLYSRNSPRMINIQFLISKISRNKWVEMIFSLSENVKQYIRFTKYIIFSQELWHEADCLLIDWQFKRIVNIAMILLCKDFLIDVKEKGKSLVKLSCILLKKAFIIMTYWNIQFVINLENSPEQYLSAVSLNHRPQ